ncbi:hypothetical protein [Bradyrhizobium sp. Ce-3]|uniref:hypothetical protein n=1 Tax=Bradyrhizobium sp. Ce-3 TaxID=2913970 RepID=UPI001FBBC4F2|nr:hypothetical protein [Bradyrhizobium sp. Ce-3]GKQ50439.1 hypothetical protein BRSPCE3_12940 [Bradyrhizobium sp. Ce-3]
MLTALPLALSLVLLLALCGWMSYRLGFRDGREQGLTDSYELYVTKAGAATDGRPGKQGPDQMPFRISSSARVAIGSMVFALVSSAVLYLVPASPLDPHLVRGAFRLYQGHAYLIPVKYVDGALDAARLYEDDKLLGPANSVQQEIIDKGAGRFSFYRDTWNYFGPALMFSTSDNSDPNTNGRKYRLR